MSLAVRFKKHLNTINMARIYKTPFQKKKELRDSQIYNDYQMAITADPQASRTAVRNYLMDKYTIGSTATFYAILHRVEKRFSQ